ncbi:mannitol dehydrogenase family protein [Paractinoplanes brasiliensis]|uniref:Mannitol-1-phosphate 5-dehydrogenase n=1 Tax=Paractinoplanes brasiliensis TaxID=52695 RepID=A0A4R6J6H6_9ACTN|nr:mannitol dehydrogenase family protein [Actinoplanes brasiliensis]TDO31074.1 mannitol 2-dehydrogenase [Actinoplanes brasiliensis]GID33292.1 mannitol 2-dehydrogenase [Actinoplanes brasiliensis]
MLPLNAETLRHLPDGLAVPSYDRGALSTGIVHFGVGGFHRAHQAMYLDRLMNEGKALDWAICGVGVMPADRRMQQVLDAQDGLYTLVVKAPDGTLDARVIGSIKEYLFAPDDPEAVIEKMASPEVRIVSLTVTEGGYNFNAVTGEFMAGNKDIQHDLAQPGLPRTTFGLITAAVQRRRERGLPPFTIMSCDNIQGNGDAARRSFVAFASLRGDDLASYVESSVLFPNSMVDRITPVTTDDDRAEVAKHFGIEDGWPVVCEPFTQWALEDSFGNGRPPWEDAGVQVVPDVEPYELMKLRLLNASHQALCYFGYLSGYRLVHDVTRDPVFAKFLLTYMEKEAEPTLEPVPGIDLREYQHQLIDRFSNAQVKDTVARLCAESSDRIPKWLLPVIRHNLDAGGDILLSTAVVASWARYAEGVDEQGEPIEIVDGLRDKLTAAARRQHENPVAFIEDREVFGDLIESERFVSAYRSVLASLHSRGAKATLDALVSGSL